MTYASQALTIDKSAVTIWGREAQQLSGVRYAQYRQARKISGEIGLAARKILIYRCNTSPKG